MSDLYQVSFEPFTLMNGSYLRAYPIHETEECLSYYKNSDADFQEGLVALGFKVGTNRFQNERFSNLRIMFGFWFFPEALKKQNLISFGEKVIT